MRFLEEDEDDPILSVVNLVDLFVVIIGILMILLVQNPLNPFRNENVIVIENPGEADMRMTIKQGEELTRYESSGEIGEGEGVKAGIAYRLPDGRMIYVPEDE
ncbi:hypothetical protein HAD_00920 [Hyphomonas adhaerens MHS-3]|uniref:DUF2149 domain-containing protein n=1 Tax=Hyphomonas adhaerens MHS-3 TaxID=1280949 RepID=A0A069E2V9_9PROT|nr:DUF2149 domain-containing protein [Hyphomonas adhaerens]KCZ84197.1 hypothetical protein HAD_00920 [Hyphomonas adhaerens MHS-3]